MSSAPCWIRTLRMTAPAAPATTLPLLRCGCRGAHCNVGLRLLELGPVGLVDARLLQDARRTVDPQWDSTCSEVLSSFVNEWSNPTKQSVIGQADREFQRQVQEGKVPATAVAYRRLEQLDEGRYTFGVAKQRRSVAKQPIWGA